MAPSKDSDQNGDAGVPKSGGVGKAAGNPGMT